jgi:hypothetical protein
MDILILIFVIVTLAATLGTLAGVFVIYASRQD